MKFSLLCSVQLFLFVCVQSASIGRFLLIIKTKLSLKLLKNSKYFGPKPIELSIDIFLR